jgi:Tol biopolymer transport system component
MQMVGRWLAMAVSAVMSLAGCVTAGYTRLDAGGQYVYTNPAWSPDGRKIAYTRYEIYDQDKGYRTSSGEIFVLDVAANQATPLTHNDVADTRPVWSPDGQRLVFVRQSETLETDAARLYVIDADGENEQLIFRCPSACGTPAWSPVDDRIAFYLVARSPAATDQNGSAEIYVIDASGDHLTQVTHGHGQAFGPRWSPDGKQLVIHRAGDQPIHLVDVTSGEETALDLKGARGPIDPVWAHDGSGIVYAAYGEHGARRLFIYSFADGSVQQLLNTSGSFPPDMVEPDWSRDGTQIVFSVFYQKLYVADVAVTRAR